MKPIVTAIFIVSGLMLGGCSLTNEQPIAIEEFLVEDETYADELEQETDEQECQNEED